MIRILTFLILGLSLFWASPSPAEDEKNAGEEYPGIEDPFGPPITQQYRPEVKRPKVGVTKPRTFMLGADLGIGMYTGGLGDFTGKAPYFGVRGVYFIKPNFAIEAALHYVVQLDELRQPSGTNIQADIDTTLLPITLAARYYFGSPEETPFIAVANPYIVGGVGAYFRNQNVLTSNIGLSGGWNFQIGVLFGAGVEIPVVENKFYLGAEFRYHLIFFFDESDTINSSQGNTLPGARAGDYISPALTFTYSF